MKRPYEGVTSGNTPEPKMQITEIYDKPGSDIRPLCLGFLAAKETFNTDLGGKFDCGWMLREDIPEINTGQPANNRGVSSVVVMDVGEKSAPESKIDYLRRITNSMIGAYTAARSLGPIAIQFNGLPWHKIDCEFIFATIKQISKGKMGVILECSPEMAKAQKPAKMAEKIGELACRGLIDYILFDITDAATSEVLEPYINEAKKRTNGSIQYGVTRHLSLSMSEIEKYLEESAKTSELTVGT